MLFITLVPLSVYIYSIGAYSNFITSSDHNHKKELVRTVFENVFTGKYRSNVLMIGSVITENNNFLSTINSDNQQGLNEYLQNASQRSVIKKVILKYLA